MCANCGGAILEPNVSYCYSGKICYCPIDPKKMYQNPISENTHPQMIITQHLITEDSKRLDWLLKHQVHGPVYECSFGWGYCGNCGTEYFKTPREAIDAAMSAKDEKNG
jgi:hypothetical protein